MVVMLELYLTYWLRVSLVWLIHHPRLSVEQPPRKTAVELVLPEATAHLHGRALLESLLESWPRVFSYVISFTVIAIFWAANNQFYQHVRRLDGRLLWLAILKLGCIAFIPFPTAVLGEHIDDLVAQQFYFGSLLLTGLASAAFCWYASSGRRLVGPDLNPRVIRHYRLLIGVIVPASLILLMALTAVGIGRLVNPVVVIYLVAIGYIVLGVYEWREPPETKREAVEEVTPESASAEERRQEASPGTRMAE
jgi:uncharacterized membrane protein